MPPPKQKGEISNTQTRKNKRAEEGKQTRAEKKANLIQNNRDLRDPLKGITIDDQINAEPIQIALNGEIANISPTLQAIIQVLPKDSVTTKDITNAVQSLVDYNPDAYVPLTEPKEIEAKLNELVSQYDIPERIRESNELIHALFGRDVLTLVKESDLSLRDVVELQAPKTQGKNVQNLARLIAQSYESAEGNIYPDDPTKQSNAIRNYNTAQSLLADFEGGRCYICGGELRTSTPELEHICPVAEALGILHIIQEQVREFIKMATDANHFLWSDEAYAAMLEYRDSHLCCNRIKSSTTFLKEKNGGYEIDEEGIKTYLGDVYDSIMGPNGNGKGPARVYNDEDGCANKVLRDWFKSFGGRANFIQSRYYGVTNPGNTPGMSKYVGDIVEYVNQSFERYGNLAYLIAIANQALGVSEKLWEFLTISTGNPELVKKFKLAVLEREENSRALQDANIPKITGSECLEMLNPWWSTIQKNKDSYETNKKAIEVVIKLRQDTLASGVDLFANLFTVEEQTIFAPETVRRPRSEIQLFDMTGRPVNRLNLINALNIRFNQFKNAYIQACLNSPDYYNSYPFYLSQQGFNTQSIILSCQNNNYMFGMDYMIKLLNTNGFSMPSVSAVTTLKMLKNFMININEFTDIYIYLYILLSIGVDDQHSLVIGIPNELNDRITLGAYSGTLSKYTGPQLSDVKENFKSVSFTIFPRGTPISPSGEFYPENSLNIDVLNNYASFVSTYPAYFSEASDLFNFLSSSVLTQTAVDDLPQALQAPNEEEFQVSPGSSAYATPFGSQPSSQETFLTTQGGPFEQSSYSPPPQQGNRFATLGNQFSPSSSQGSTPDTMDGGRRRKKRYTRKIIKKYTKKIHKKNKFRRTKKRKY
jgi:hypothetical protein